jgi:hypothetical protein
VPVVVARDVPEEGLGQHLGEPFRENHSSVQLAALLAEDDEVGDAIGEPLDRQPRLGARRARLRIGHLLGDREIAHDVLDAEDEMGFARDGDAVGEPSRFSAHRLDDEVSAGRHGVGAQVEQLVGHDVDRREEAEREIDAAIVVVDRLGDVNDAHVARAGWKTPLILVQ